MLNKFEALDKLVEYEKRFSNEIKEKKIVILRDVTFDKEEYEEIRRLIRILLEGNFFEYIKSRCGLTLSLYIVWCVIYNYKDGDMWNSVLEGINVKTNAKNSRIIGEIFLDTLRQYKLLTIDDHSSKKYFSPILMHGYISDNYSGKLFDTLDRFYENLLYRDSSISNIELVWDLMFPSEDDSGNLYSQKKSIEKEIAIFESQLSDQTNKDYFIDISKGDLEIYEQKLIGLEEEIVALCSKRDNLIEEINDQDDTINMSEDILKKAGNISDSEKLLDNKELQTINYIKESFLELAYLLKQENACKTEEYKNISDSIKKLQNEQIIKNRKLVDIKTKVSILGSGDLEAGLDIITEIKEAESNIIAKKRQLENINSMIEIEKDLDQGTFVQIYTASLYHLKKTAPEIFKDFIIKTIQSMDMYFINKEVNPEYILHEQLGIWYNEAQPKRIYRKNPGIINHFPDKEITGHNLCNKKKYKMMDRFSSPRLEMGSDKSTIQLVFSEKIVTKAKSGFGNPVCRLTYQDETQEDIELTYKYQGDKSIVYEERLVLNESLYRADIYWMNLRNCFEFMLDMPLVFDKDGKIIDKKVLDNGIYYILAGSDWECMESGYISRNGSSIKGYYIYEAELNEMRLSFINQINKTSVDFNASRYSNIHLSSLNIVPGVTVEGIQIISGHLPKLSYNRFVIEDDNLTLKILINDYLNIEVGLAEVCVQDEIKDNLCIFDIEKFVEKYSYPVKLEVSINEDSGEKIFSDIFFWTSNTDFKYDKNEIIITHPEKSRVKHSRARIFYDKAVIPLINNPIEQIDIYYNKYGIFKFYVEVPKMEINISNDKDQKLPSGSEILKDDLTKYKDYYINIEVVGSIVNSVEINNIQESFNIVLPLKNNTAKIRFDEIRDLMCEDSDIDSLMIRCLGNKYCGEFEDVLKIYKNWKISDVDIYQEEQHDQYLLEIRYNQNFSYSGEKFIRVLNDDFEVFEKELDSYYSIFYIRKDNLLSDKLQIEIFRKKKSGLFGGRSGNINAVDKINVVLKSKINEIEKIKSGGISLSSFMYKKSEYKMQNPLKIVNISDSQPLNFIGESLFTGTATASYMETEVIFYLDTERKRVPLLLDKDRDGVQYDKESEEFFWEIRKGSNIIGPVEDFHYEIEVSE